MPMTSSARRLVAIPAILALAAGALAACGSSSSDSSGAKAAKATASVDLAKAGCPSTIVIQTDWYPEAEHGHLYEMLGKDAKIDTSKKTVSGTLMLDGKSTGVNVEIRAGGPAIGNAQPVTQMYTDKSITMAYVTTDDQINTYGKTPSKAFFAPLDESPIMVMWDPSTYPKVDSVKSAGAALAASGGVWRYFGGSAYMQYLMNSKYVAKKNTDSSYDGTPAVFVAAKGKDMQQGFASAEPYQYQHVITKWGKPVKYALVSSTGWDPYQSSMAVRTADFSKMSKCLKAFTPVLQQEEVDYFKNPTAANDLILKAVKEYNAGWSYSAGLADYSKTTMLADKLVSNGDNAYLGDFNAARMSDFLTKATTTFNSMGNKVDSKLTVDDLYTNEFIDKSIGLK